MIAELGHFALILALAASLAQGVLLLAGARRGDPVWMAAGRQAAIVHPLLVATSFAALTASFLINDFTVKAVATQSHSALPAAFRVAAVWGSHDGSMLLWVTMLALWTLALRFASKRLPLDLACRALGILGLVSTAFLALVIATSNPFARLLPAPAEGQGLNPLLQDPLMLLHPPLLHAGYVGLAVVFSLALAALLDGRLEAAWARWSRPWALAAWCFLTLGIGVGAFWADREPGWGGWWSWDPVENASLMPWLAATALLHSLAVAEKRGLFRRGTAFIAILAFALSILGIYIARSGTLSSVHDFALDPRRGVVILALLAVVAGTAAILFARRIAPGDDHGRFEMISREAVLAASNAVLLSALGAVMLGTLYPIVAGALGLGRFSVGSSYFTSVFVALMLPGLVLLGPGPRFRWGSEAAREAARDAIRPAAAAAATAAFAALGADRTTTWVVVGLFLSVWIAWNVFEAVAFRWHRDAGLGAWRAVVSAPASFYAMHLAHLGVAVFIAGLALSSGYQESAEVVLAPGATESVGALQLRSEGARQVEGPNYRSVRVRIVARDGVREIVLEPERRRYGTSMLAVTQAAVHAGFTRDLHVALAEPAADGAWVVRVQVRPYMSWIWGGGLLMALGGLLAAADRRYRVRVAARADAQEAALAFARSASP